VRLYFATIGVALLVAAFVQAPLAWDGSYVVFTTLDHQALYSSHGRYYHTVLTIPLLALSHITSDMAILRSAYVLTEAAAPLIALGLSWLVVRKRASSLFLWPALSIGVATLPGQFAFDSEGFAAVQLFWPLILLLLLEDRPGSYIAIAALVFVQLMIYPIAIALLAIAALICVCIGAVDVPARRARVTLAIVFLVLGLVRFLLPWPEYDTQVLAPDQFLPNLVATFRYSVIGRPLLALGGATLGGVLTVLAQRQLGTKRVPIGNLTAALAMASVSGTALVLLPWAAEATSWASAEAFRFWALPASLPLITMAVLEGARSVRSGTTAELTRERLRVVQVAGLVFFLVLTMQGWSWRSLQRRLTDTLVEDSGRCVPASSLAWANGTPLSYWTLPYNSLVLQARSPATVVLDDGGCAAPDFARRIRLAPWDLRDRDKGWFDLRSTGVRDGDAKIASPH
jgi:hypothetical protein